MKFRVEAEFEGGFSTAAQVEEVLATISQNVPSFRVTRLSELRERVPAKYERPKRVQRSTPEGE